MSNSIRVYAVPGPWVDLGEGFRWAWERRFSAEYPDGWSRLDIWERTASGGWGYSHALEGLTVDDCLEEFHDWVSGRMCGQVIE